MDAGISVSLQMYPALIHVQCPVDKHEETKKDNVINTKHKLKKGYYMILLSEI